jgi:hypothetical protein
MGHLPEQCLSDKNKLDEFCRDDSTTASRGSAFAGFQIPMQTSHQLSKKIRAKTGFESVLPEPVFSLPAH